MTRLISVQMLYYFYRLWIGIKKLLVLIEMARQVSSKKILLLLDIFYIVFTASMVYLLTYPLHPRWDTRHPSMVLLTYPLHPRWDTRHPSMVLLIYLSSSSPMGHKASINGVMVSILTSNAVDCRFESKSGQTKDYHIESRSGQTKDLSYWYLSFLHLSCNNKK